MPQTTSTFPSRLEELRLMHRALGPGGTGTLLVVEDDDLIRSALKAGLELVGYRVTAVANGRDALAEVERERPALIVLDVMMPELDGQGFTRELEHRGWRRDLPIIMISADAESRQRAAELGADGFLAKPLTLPLLVREIARLLERPGQ